MTCFDIRIKNNEGTAILIAGPSGSGKTYRTMSFIECKNYIFTNPACMQKILFYYNVETDLFKKYRHMENIEWINEYPKNLSYIEETANKYKDTGGCTVIIDDFASQLAPSLEKLFTALSHHKNITIFLITQNLFFGSKTWQRNISLNCKHFLIFPNYRDKNQFNQFARQLEPIPGQAKYLIEAYDEVAKRADYSYLWVNCEPNLRNKFLRIKTNVFKDEWPILFYVPKESRFEQDIC